MNFLAHFLTARSSDELLSGSFVGDFVRGGVDRQVERFRAGIALHRRVDAFTDDHALVREAVARLRPACGRYAPVALDVIFDHLLAGSWSRWSDEPLGAFTSHVYGVLLRDLGDYPPGAARVAAALSSGDWLGSYASEEGIRFALKRMTARLRRPADLAAGLDVVLRDRDAFQRDFERFFADLLREVNPSASRHHERLSL
jgi:acyl carrier protein phosphodiesterase